VHSSQAIIDSLTAIENQTSSIAQEHNALARQIYTSTGVQMALDSININFDDLILEPLVPVLPELPSGVTLATDPSDPHYSDLVDAVNYYESLGQIAQTSGYQEVSLLRELGWIGIEMADDAFAAGQNLTGEQILKGALTALDMSLDFVPGLSLLKDSISIVTGINPVTGEALSSTERAILGASFFAPAILSGTLKATVKLGKAAKKLINAGQDATGLADELVDAIRLSDEGLAKYVDTPCSPVGSLSGGASILSQGVSSSTPCPLGSVTDSMLNLFKPKKVIALAESAPGEVTVAMIKEFTVNNYRENAKKLYNRMDLPSDWDVHHIFPKNFTSNFKGLGLWVNDPRLLVPLPNRFHQLMHSNGYNDIWTEFLSTNPSRDQILDMAKELAEKFEFSEYLGGYF